MASRTDDVGGYLRDVGRLRISGLYSGGGSVWFRAVGKEQILPSPRIRLCWYLGLRLVKEGNAKVTLGEVLTGLGFVVGFVVLWLEARRQKLLTTGMQVIALAGFIGGILGAKVTQLLVDGWPITAPWWVIFDPKAGGKALFGGLILGWISVIVTKRKLGIKRGTGDLFALALPAGESVGRLGCFFQCCYGTVCEAPWSVHQHGAERHPVQLYSALTAAILFAILIVLKPRLRREGDLWRTYLLGFGSTRFFLEFLRANDSYILGLTAMQWLCLELVAYVLLRAMWIRIRESQVHSTIPQRP